jgi:hypothetical protein
LLPARLPARLPASPPPRLLQFAERGTLKKLILSQMINPTRKLYSLQDAVFWGMQMAQGLAYLHSNNPMVSVSVSVSVSVRGWVAGVGGSGVERGA